MITVEQAKLICGSANLSDIECLNVIRPRQVFQLELMNIAFESACKYYLNN